MNATSLKAKIRNLANDKKIPAQVLLQNYMFERFLERLSLSEYKDKFILKGGMLIAALVGIETRTTMDLDVTIRAYPLDEGHIRSAIDEICATQIDDNIRFRTLGIDSIRKEDKYGGLRISLEAAYDSVVVPISIDVTSGDAITPNAVRRHFTDTFNEEKKIEIWTYNVETVLAEKVETILRRGVFNTRMRDFYDVYILSETQDYDIEVFRQAIRATAGHRGTTSQISDIQGILNSIRNDADLLSSWRKYQREYPYAAKVDFEGAVLTLEKLLIAG